MTASDEDAIALLRIELEDIEPLIWRRVAVPTSMSLKAVHNVIQAAMGWLDNHLWEFKTNEGKYGILIPNDPDWNERINNAATTKLSALLATGVTEIGYIYDIGDNWQHRIIVEKLKPAEPGALYPQFLGGERRCPPEDCGGFPGYYDFLDNIASKQTKSTKLHSIGMAAPTTRTTSMSSRSPSISNALPTLDAPAAQNPSRHDACVDRLTLTS